MNLSNLLSERDVRGKNQCLLGSENRAFWKASLWCFQIYYERPICIELTFGDFFPPSHPSISFCCHPFSSRETQAKSSKNVVYYTTKLERWRTTDNVITFSAHADIIPVKGAEKKCMPARTFCIHVAQPIDFHGNALGWHLEWLSFVNALKGGIKKWRHFS